MSTMQPTPSPAAPPPAMPVADERLANISLASRILRRPEIGALLAAVVVAIFFWSQNALFLRLDGIANWTDVASTIGIPAVLVALLMIGGEFDLSAGGVARSARPVSGGPSPPPDQKNLPGNPLLALGPRRGRVV